LEVFGFVSNFTKLQNMSFNFLTALDYNPDLVQRLMNACTDVFTKIPTLQFVQLLLGRGGNCEDILAPKLYELIQRNKKIPCSNVEMTNYRIAKHYSGPCFVIKSSARIFNRSAFY